MKQVSIVTLGCSKNDVDSNQMRGILDEEKYRFTNSVTDAEVIVVNTCGFIDAAKEESIDTILDLARLKTEGKLETLLLAGCLAQRYPDELLESIPEADGIIGPGHIRSINDAIEGAYENKKPVYTDSIETDYIESFKRDEVSITEYVKISEGCNNRCTYCIIPYLKGNNISRPMEAIIDEIQNLVARGTREVILIAQNTTDYGIDLYGRYALVDLLKALRDIEELKWVRILYAYPDHFDDALIDEMRDNPKVLPYIDIPIQHASNNVLRAMNRKTDRKSIEQLIERLRLQIPHMAIRSTFLLGFPGETDDDFQEVMDFIENTPIDRAGAFAYSKEEGTPAADMEDQIADEIKGERVENFMAAQMLSSENLMEKHIGRTLEVLITEEGDGGYIGRSYLDAPDIDGIVTVQSEKVLEPGEFVYVEITEASAYDLGGIYIEHSK
ncbi:30S ribosomal protein S12 methylthiotransferase RimO [Aedoeadaptatus coxii]|uniref:Ribosomal protein uS12 methylthiotransferase RimO n=1 Tax=Aedoeadaptatus coxii TaxID=755172 RepID=A0A134ABI3_9FIRM|nr:30S ribosomal protein S12 methylthiotransferase RimO [Peptoniphilus coxii]KXB65072.1 ribosomal protein S12 methylthiotransferase RimO [Peptoniphilus coxii]